MGDKQKGKHPRTVPGRDGALRRLRRRAQRQATGPMSQDRAMPGVCSARADLVKNGVKSMLLKCRSEVVPGRSNVAMPDNFQIHEGRFPDLFSSYLGTWALSLTALFRRPAQTKFFRWNEEALLKLLSARHIGQHCKIHAQQVTHAIQAVLGL
jgi:hypothetical protein